MNADDESKVGSDFTPRVAGQAESFSKGRMNLFDPSGSSGMALGGIASRSLGFSDKLLDTYWAAPSLNFGVRMLGSGAFGNYRDAAALAAPSWVFPTPWYADELDWLSSEQEQYWQQTVSVEPTASPSLEYVAPSLASQSKMPRAVNRMAARPQLASRARLLATRTNTSLPSAPLIESVHEQWTAEPRMESLEEPLALQAAPLAMATISQRPPAAIRHLAWSDNAIGQVAGQSQSLFDISNIQGAQLPQVVYVAPTIEQSPERAVSHLPTVVDDSQPASMDELSLLVAPRPRIAAPHPGITPSVNAAVANSLPARVSSGIQPALISSPVRSLIGQSTDAPIFDTRAIDPRPRIFRQADGAPTARTFLGGQESSHGQHRRPSTVPSMTVLSMPPIAPRIAGMLATNAGTFAVQASEQATSLTDEFVTPELVAATRTYGLGPSMAVSAAKIAAGGPDAVRHMARTVDLEFVSAMDPQKEQAQRSVTSRLTSTQTLPRGAFLYPDAALDTFDITDQSASLEQRAALDVVSAAQLARMPMVAAAESVATNRTEDTLPEKQSQTVSRPDVLTKLQMVLASSPEGRSMSPTVRAAKAMVAYHQLTGSVESPSQILRETAKYLPQVFAGALPKVERQAVRDGQEPRSTQEQAVQVTPVVARQAGSALRQMITPQLGASTAPVKAGQAPQPVLHAPTPEQEYVAVTTAKQEAMERAEAFFTEEVAESEAPQLPAWFQKAAKRLLSRKASAPEDIVIRELALVNTGPTSEVPQHMAAKPHEDEPRVQTQGTEGAPRVRETFSEDAVRKALRQIREYMYRDGRGVN